MNTLIEIASALNAKCKGKNHTWQGGVSIDSRTIAPGDLYVAMIGQNADGHQFVEDAKKRGALAAIINKEVITDLPVIKVADTHQALIDLARWYRQCMSTIKVVAVTGSCGKTTSRALLQSIFSQAGPTLASIKSFNNDIGVPVTLLNLKMEHRYLICEMGANHSGEIAQLTHLAKPDVAIITLAAPAHLEGFGNMEGVACAKGEIFQGLSDKGVAIINADDQFARFWKRLAGVRRVMTFGLREQADVTAKKIKIQQNGTASFILHYKNQALPVQLQLIGHHNVMNALAAATAGFALGLTMSQIQVGLNVAHTEKNRLVLKRGVLGARVIDDSYNANPSSMQAAIEILTHFSGDTILVMGDMLELGQNANIYHAKIGEFAREKGVNQLYCYGQHSRFAANAFGTKAYHFDDQLNLINVLRKQLHVDMTVLIKGSNSMHMHRIADALTEE